MCDVPSIAVFCSESIECFPGTVSKFFFKPLVIIIIIIIIIIVVVVVVVVGFRSEYTVHGLPSRKGI